MVYQWPNFLALLVKVPFLERILLSKTVLSGFLGSKNHMVLEKLGLESIRKRKSSVHKTMATLLLYGTGRHVSNPAFFNTEWIESNWKNTGRRQEMRRGLQTPRVWVGMGLSSVVASTLYGHQTQWRDWDKIQAKESTPPWARIPQLFSLFSKL